MGKVYFLSESTKNRLQQFLDDRSVDATGGSAYLMRGEGGLKSPHPFAVRFSVQADSFLVYIPEEGALLGIEGGYTIEAKPPRETETYKPPENWYAVDGGQNIYAVITRLDSSDGYGDSHPGDSASASAGAYAVDLAAAPSTKEGAVNVLIAAVESVKSSSGADAWLVAQLVTGAIALPGSGRGDADSGENAAHKTIETGDLGLQLYGVDAESLGSGETLLKAVTPTLKDETLTPGPGIADTYVVAIRESSGTRTLTYIPLGTGDGEEDPGDEDEDDCDTHPSGDPDAHPGDGPSGGLSGAGGIGTHPGDTPNWCK